MGYRSQVRGVIYGEPDKLQAFITKAMLEGCSALTHFADDLRRYRSVRRIYDHEATALQQPNHNGGRTLQFKLVPIEVLDLRGDDWKWYEDYPDVRAWHDLMAEAPEFGLNYEFMRIGEETADIEEQSGVADPDNDDGERFLSVARTIEDDLNVEQELEITGAALEEV